jgi:hypothetical protein
VKAVIKKKRRAKADIFLVGNKLFSVDEVRRFFEDPCFTFL